MCVLHCIFVQHRIERIDFLDERELLDQLLRHYCLSGAHLDSQQLGELCLLPLVYSSERTLQIKDTLYKGHLILPHTIIHQCIIITFERGMNPLYTMGIAEIDV